MISWLEISLSIIIIIVAFFTGMSSSPLYSERIKKKTKDNEAEKESWMKKLSKISINDKLSKFSDHWSPKVIAEINDYQKFA